MKISIKFIKFGIAVAIFVLSIINFVYLSKYIDAIPKDMFNYFELYRCSNLGEAIMILASCLLGLNIAEFIYNLLKWWEK